MRLAVALLDFGGPQNADELEPFLSELLADVLPGPSWFTRVAGPVLARRRAPIVRPQYEAIGWSPLVPTHLAQADALRSRLGADLPVVSGMMFTEPTMDRCARALGELQPEAAIAIPLFPHYSLATTHAAFNFFHAALGRNGLGALPVHWVPAYFDHPRYIEALAGSIRAGVAETPGEGPVHLVFTPHGLPVSFVQRGDPYPDHVRSTVRAVLRALDWTDPSHLGWQSKVGPSTWLTPSTPDVLRELGASGVRRICLVPVSFVSEHIETLHEIDIEYRHTAQGAGITHVGRAPALGLAPEFIDTLADLAHAASRDLAKQHCVRCLRERTPVEPVRAICPNCKFRASAGQLHQPHPREP